MPGLIGTKLGMTSVFSDDGDLIPVTVIKVDPCKVVNIKTTDKDGYEAVQLGGVFIIYRVNLVITEGAAPALGCVSPARSARPACPARPSRS